MIAAKSHKGDTRVCVNEWERWFFGNWARGSSLMILANGICTNLGLTDAKFSSEDYTDKKRIGHLVDYAVPADKIVKIRRKEKS